MVFCYSCLKGLKHSTTHFLEYKPIGKKRTKFKQRIHERGTSNHQKHGEKSSISRIITDKKIQTMRFHTPKIGDNFPNLTAHCVDKSLKQQGALIYS